MRLISDRYRWPCSNRGRWTCTADGGELITKCPRGNRAIRERRDDRSLSVRVQLVGLRTGEHVGGEHTARAVQVPVEKGGVDDDDELGLSSARSSF